MQPRSFLSLLNFAVLSFRSASAQCATAGYVPCLAPGSSTPAAPPSLTPAGASAFWSPLQMEAMTPIQGRKQRDLTQYSALEDRSEAAKLEERQNSLCCRPSPVECLHSNGVPFCYNPDTTRLYFSDGSVAYTSNDTYYGADGTFIDFKNNIYQYPDGTKVQLTDSSSSSATSSAGTSGATGTSSASGSNTSGSSSSSSSGKSTSSGAVYAAPMGFVSIALGVAAMLL